MFNKTEQEIMSKWKGDIDTPAVSVICVTYNHEKYIEEAICSFLMQETDFPFEIIIGEDCSPDGTAKIVEQYAKKYPNLIQARIRSKNMGAEANFRDCFENSRCDLIAVCEGDDYWTDKTKLLKQYNFMVNNKDYSFIFTPAIQHTNEIEKVRNRYSQSEIDNIDLKWVLLKGGGFYPTVTSLYKKEVLYNIPGWFLNTHSAGDYAIAISAALNGKIGYLDDVTGYYRIQHNSMSNKKYNDKNDCKQDVEVKYNKNIRFISNIFNYNVVNEKFKNLLVSKEDYVYYAKLIDCGCYREALKGVIKIKYSLKYKIRLLLKFFYRLIKKKW